MVVVVRVLGGFVGAAAAVGADDGGEGAGADGEEDFEGEGEVADEGVAVLGSVDACGADGEADDAGEGAAFYCCAGGRGELVFGGFVVGWLREVGVGVLLTCRKRLHLLLLGKPSCWRCVFVVVCMFKGTVLCSMIVQK